MESWPGRIDAAGTKEYEMNRRGFFNGIAGLAASGIGTLIPVVAEKQPKPLGIAITFNGHALDVLNEYSFSVKPLVAKDGSTVIASHVTVKASGLMLPS